MLIGGTNGRNGRNCEQNVPICIVKFCVIRARSFVAMSFVARLDIIIGQNKKKFMIYVQAMFQDIVMYVFGIFFIMDKKKQQ